MKKNFIVKSLSMVLVVLMVCASLVACGAKVEKAEYDLGIGLVMGANVEANTTTATVAAVVLDAEGKIALCRVDEIAVAATVEGEEVKVAKSYKSNSELGNDADAKAFEAALVGKTAADVDAIEAADSLKGAVKAALASEHKVAFKASAEMTAGVGITASADVAEGVVTVACDAAVAVVDGGKVATAAIDSIEDNYTVGTGLAGKASKLAQGDAYGMVAWGGSISEWYTQAQVYANTAIGKAPADVANLETEGVAGCTIYVGGYKVALVKAAEAVR